MGAKAEMLKSFLLGLTAISSIIGVLFLLIWTGGPMAVFAVIGVFFLAFFSWLVGEALRESWRND